MTLAYGTIRKPKAMNITYTMMKISTMHTEEQVAGHFLRVKKYLFKTTSCAPLWWSVRKLQDASPELM